MADALVELDTDGADKTSSKIWSERYASAGDFQFKTHRVDETLELLPEGSLIALRDSEEVMWVESNSIADSDKGPELTITGRSFETFLENRVALGPTYQKPWAMKRPYSTLGALMTYIWNSVVNPTSLDVTIDSVWAHNNKNNIPNLRVSNSSTLVEAQSIWWLQSGIVYTSVLDFLSLGTLGLRNIRPVSTNAKIINVLSNGDINQVLTANIPQLRIDIYNGTDRTKNQSVVDKVIFNFDQGHMDSPSYLFSTKEYINHAVVQSSIGISHTYVGDDDTRTGFDRRSTWIDGGTKDAETPWSSFEVQQKRKGKVELNARRKTKLIDAVVNPFSPYIYGEDYFLGDKITVMGERGFNQTMMVSEYVRTEDKTGETGVPTLAVPD